MATAAGATCTGIDSSFSVNHGCPIWARSAAAVDAVTVASVLVHQGLAARGTGHCYEAGIFVKAGRCVFQLWLPFAEIIFGIIKDLSGLVALIIRGSFVSRNNRRVIEKV